MSSTQICTPLTHQTDIQISSTRSSRRRTPLPRLKLLKLSLNNRPTRLNRSASSNKSLSLAVTSSTQLSQPNSNQRRLNKLRRNLPLISRRQPSRELLRERREDTTRSKLWSRLIITQAVPCSQMRIISWSNKLWSILISLRKPILNQKTCSKKRGKLKFMLNTKLLKSSKLNTKLKNSITLSKRRKSKLSNYWTKRERRRGKPKN